MRLLLDTHAFIWFDAGDGRLGEATRRLIQDRSNEVYVSVASFWEMAIKASMGRLALRTTVSQLMVEAPAQNDLTLLPILPHHLAEVQALPFHHRDPFDRMLVAQARADGLTLVSRDAALGGYAVERRW